MRKLEPKNMIQFETVEKDKNLLRLEIEEKEFDLEHKKATLNREKELTLEKSKIELEKLRHESQKAHYEAKVAEISYKINQREEDKLLSSDRYNHVYRFTYEVMEASVADCMSVLSRWSRLDPGCEMEVIFCSPGGSLTEGFALYDFIQDLKRKGHRVATKTVGYAASMAGVLLQAGTTRVMGKESWMLIHEGSFGIQGKANVVEDAMEWFRKMREHVVDIFAMRASDKTGKSVKWTKDFIKKNWNRKDWWISADEALEYGFCDKVE